MTKDLSQEDAQAVGDSVKQKAKIERCTFGAPMSSPESSKPSRHLK